MGERAGIRRAVAALLVVLGAGVLSACGGEDRQDENEPSGSFQVEVVKADFPIEHRLAKQSELVIAVRNTGQEAVPNLAVTVDGFARARKREGLADPSRPVFIVDTGPSGGDTAYVNTWSLGRLAPGATKTFRWRVTPVEPGKHTVRYRVAAGLDGRAKAQRPGGGPVQSEFAVNVESEPAPARVDDSGRVVREQ